MKLAPGSIVVITGAASGIGEGLARECVERGYRAALADIEGPALRALVADLDPSSRTVVSGLVDVASPDSVDGFAQRVLEGPGIPDLVIANAGVIGPAVPMWEQSTKDWEWIIGVNLLGVVNTWAAFLPAMIERGTGHVVATASVAGLAPGQSIGNAPYAATKYGVVGLCDNLRIELSKVAPEMLVTALVAGPVRSRIRQATRNRPDAYGGPEVPQMLANDPFPSRLEADEFAKRVFDGLERSPRYLLPNEDFVEPVASHLDGIAAELRGSQCGVFPD